MKPRWNFHAACLLALATGPAGERPLSGQEIARVADLNPGPAGGGPSYLTVCRDTLHFSANDGQVGGELGTLREGVFALSLIPRLTLRRLDGQVAISWPAWAGGYELQESFQLPARAWRPVSETPRRTENRWETTIAPSTGPHFFRLQLP